MPKPKGVEIADYITKTTSEFGHGVSSYITGSSSPKTKTKVTTYKRGKHKGEVKKIKTISTDASGYITKQKVKMKGGEIIKSKIKKSKRGILGILGAKTKAKYTKRSGTTLVQQKGKVDPTKVAKKALTTAALGASGALWAGGTLASLKVGTSAFGPTAAGVVGTLGLTGAAGIGTGSAVADTMADISTETMRTGVKGKVTKGRAVQSEWGKMGA